MATCTVYARTDVGLVRHNNEDSYLVDDRRGLAIVADGMGGHAAGEVASALAIDLIAAGIPAEQGRWPFGRKKRERTLLLQAIHTANERIQVEAAEDERRRGMGTTVVVLWIRGTRAHLAHVGDSRLYRWRRPQLTQLTTDHALPGPDGRPGNVLTRALGAEATVMIDHTLLSIERGDIFLLCSDGLTATVDDREIAGILDDASNGEAACARLIERALAAGAPDNVTVAVAYC